MDEKETVTHFPTVTENYKGRVISISGKTTESEAGGREEDIWIKVDGKIAKEVAGTSNEELLSSAKKLIDDGKI